MANYEFPESTYLYWYKSLLDRRYGTGGRSLLAIVREFVVRPLALIPDT
jgi:hypothetical protein